MSASHVGFYANIAGARKPDIEDYIRKYRPAWVMLTEAYHARADLERMARKFGYRLRQYGRKRKGREGPSIAVLVRDDVKITYRSAMEMKRHWYGPFTGKRRSPRVHVKMTLRIDGMKWRYVFMFQPPGGPSGGVKTKGRNRRAWMEGRNKAVRTTNKKPQHPSLIVGDLNGTRQEIKLYFEDRLRGDTDMASLGKVDHIAARDARVSSDGVKERDHGHGWGVYTIKEMR